MRYGTLALLMVLAALVWSGCCRTDKVCTATNTINATTMATQEIEAAYKKQIKDRLMSVAEEERAKRTTALAKEGCPLDPKDPQPTEACKLIVETAKGHYEGRKARLVEVATKLDASTSIAYAALLTAIDVLIVVRDGAKDQWPKLAALVAEAVKVGTALADAWSKLKTEIPTY